MAVDLTLVLLAVSAVAAVVLVILGLPSFLRWWRERKQLPVQPLPASAPSPPNVQVHLWNPQLTRRDAPPSLEANDSTRPAPSATYPPSSEAVSKKPTSSVQSRRQAPRMPKEAVLFDDTLEIEATGFAEVHERLRKEVVVEGFAEEVSGQSFDFYIMDQHNYARFCEDRDGTDIYSQEGRVALNFKKKIPRDGVWYFVFDTYGKQTAREIRLELRSIEPP